MKKEANACCICGKRFSEWGNNPWPIHNEGQCCDVCNTTKVIPARINDREREIMKVSARWCELDKKSAFAIIPIPQGWKVWHSGLAEDGFHISIERKPIAKEEGKA